MGYNDLQQHTQKVLTGTHTMLVYPPSTDGPKFARVVPENGTLTVKWGRSQWGIEKVNLTDLRPRPRTIRFADEVGGQLLTSVQQYTEDNRTPYQIARPLC